MNYEIALLFCVIPKFPWLMLMSFISGNLIVLWHKVAFRLVQISFEYLFVFSRC